MTELRQDYISGQWVIMATERAGRPGSNTGKHIYYREKTFFEHMQQESCPFCPGNEGMTPPALLVLDEEGSEITPAAGRAEAESIWQVRVIPNKYPALTAGEGQSESKKRSGPSNIEKAAGNEFFRKLEGYGVHEVIIENPSHSAHPGVMPLKQMEIVIEAYFQRFTVLTEDNQNLRYIQIFRNHSREAGASLEHPHSQLLALPLVPGAIEFEMERAYRFFIKQATCIYCLMLEEERSQGRRVVAENDFFTAFMPFASLRPFETWILPRHHQTSFLELCKKERKKLAELLGRVLKMLEEVMPGTPYNYYLHTAPGWAGAMRHYHWHLEIIPKLSVRGGFEVGAGININVVLPEEAAELFNHKGRSKQNETKLSD